MQLKFMGTGDAAGVPVYGCNCSICLRAQTDFNVRRKPCSALIESSGTRILIDAGLTDLTERFPDGSLDAILLTHFHVDHTQGLFHLRWGEGKPIPVYCPHDSEGCADLYKHPGILNFEHITKFNRFDLQGVSITPIPLIHSKPTLGYCFESANVRIAYLTDTSGLPEKVVAFLKAWKPQQMVIDTRFPPLLPAMESEAKAGKPR